jgi:hypothetical protein
MATYATRPAWELRARALAGTAVAAPLGLGVLLGASLLLRTQQLAAGYWVDEGLSLGIADRPLGAIPGVMRLDGSPPLYYALLHGWIRAVGTGEVATHALSLLFALLAVPAAFWGARTLFGTRASWCAGVLAALNPFLTQYAQETRMYSLVVLFGLVACATFTRAFALPGPGERAAKGWLVAFGVALAALLYTHNWALFFALATGAVWLGTLVAAPPPARGARLRDGLLAFGVAAVLYLPWLPTLLDQSQHTGAPWSKAPPLRELLTIPAHLLGNVAQVALLFAAGAGLVALAGRRRGEHRTPQARSVLVLAAIFLLTIVLAWSASQVSPAWAVRYLAVALPPLLLLGGAGLAANGAIGLAGLALVAVMWAGDGAPAQKSNVRDVVEAITPSLQRGDLVVSTQPEQIPVLAHYLPGGLRYATLTGPVRDLGVTDWRDGVQRLRASTPRRDLEPLLDALPRGHRLVLVQPTIYDLERWSAPWTSLVRRRSEVWGQYVSNDDRFRISAIYPQSAYPEWPNAVSATVFIKVPLR